LVHQVLDSTVKKGDILDPSVSSRQWLVSPLIFASTSVKLSSV
jgi:hypothetical protein